MCAIIIKLPSFFLVLSLFDFPYEFRLFLLFLCIFRRKSENRSLSTVTSVYSRYVYPMIFQYRERTVSFSLWWYILLFSFLYLLLIYFLLFFLLYYYSVAILFIYLSLSSRKTRFTLHFLYITYGYILRIALYDYSYIDFNIFLKNCDSSGDTTLDYVER